MFPVGGDRAQNFLGALSRLISLQFPDRRVYPTLSHRSESLRSKRGASPRIEVILVLVLRQLLLRGRYEKLDKPLSINLLGPPRYSGKSFDLGRPR
jgi:hypothetical protein